MDSKILNAIQEGIKQSFMIDAEDGDEKFVKSKITAGLTITELQKRFNSLCEGFGKNYERTDDKYKHFSTSSLMDFSNIFKAMDFYRQYSFLDPYKVPRVYKVHERLEEFMNNMHIYENYADTFFKCFDISEYITFINSNNEDIPIHKLENFNNVTFIKIPDAQYPIFISIEEGHRISGFLNWQADNKDLIIHRTQSIIENLDGYANTTKLMNISKRHPEYEFPAAKHCYTQKIKNGKETYLGYLPASQQIRLISSETHIIDACLLYMGKSDIKLNSLVLWTSSSNSTKDMAVCVTNGGVTRTYECNRNQTHKVLPFFKIKPKKISKLQESQNFTISDYHDEDETFVKSKLPDGINADKIQKQFDDLCEVHPVTRVNIDEILNFYSIYGSFLKPHKLDDWDTFEKLNNMNFEYSEIFFKCFDISSILTVITSDNTEKKMHELTKYDDVIFIKMSEFILAVNNDCYMSTETYKWCEGDPQDLVTDCYVMYMDFTETELEGFAKSLDLSYESQKNKVALPVLNYCFHQMINLNGVLYQGYLPACGQLTVLGWYKRIIAHFIENVLHKPEKLLNTVQLWSSTERDVKKAWYYSLSNLGNFENDDLKTKSKFVLPFFKKIS